MTTESELNARSRMENDKSCDDCIFAERFSAQQGPAIECRRYPPSALGDSFGWPILRPDDWRGEFIAEHRI